MSATFDPKHFRQALGAFTTGVTIVTTVDEAGLDVGVTANSFNSVSLEPPMVLWSIARTSTNINAFLAASHFAVHVLARDQDALAGVFSKRGVDRFAGLSLERGPGDVPLLGGCAARFQCRTAFQYEGGDHVILVGEVLAFDHYPREPLVFHGGRFALAIPAAEPAVPAAGGSAEAPGAFTPDFLIYQLGRAYHQIFLKIQPELERGGLEIADYFALSLLGVRDDSSLSMLDAMVSYTGVRVTAETGRRLAGLGLVAAPPEDKDTRLSLTQAGKRALVELLAAAKAASDDAESGFDTSESRLLRQLLNRIIAASDPGLPTPWHP